jgi:hypothetical protein
MQDEVEAVDQVTIFQFPYRGRDLGPDHEMENAGQLVQTVQRDTGLFRFLMEVYLSLPEMVARFEAERLYDGNRLPFLDGPRCFPGQPCASNGDENDRCERKAENLSAHDYLRICFAAADR